MSKDVHAASHALRDASHYLAMSWMLELQDKPFGWPMKLATERLAEAASLLGYTLTPVAAPAQENADAA